MKNITDIIKPIRLKAGSHSDTAQTGQGCFMNVIAYLNGEPQITDQSPCVCVTIRPIAIFANDFLKDDERTALIPYIERAMGSATNDSEEVLRRLSLIVVFSQKMAKSAAMSAKSAAKSAKYAAKSAAMSAKSAAMSAKSAKSAAMSAESAKSAAMSAKYAMSAAMSAESAKSAAMSAEYAKSAAMSAKYAAMSAKYAESAMSAAIREDIKAAIFEFMDAACPESQEFSCEIIDRAEKFAKIAEHA